MRERVLELARGALAAIEASRARIDDLNVFPVPDGDTGTNLALSVRSIVEALEASGTEDREALAREVARAALMGARGNSGVILSQIVRGAAESLSTSDELAAALRGASDAAYRAVKKPVEGTMLTAIRELAEEAEAGGDLAAVIARGEDCIRRTREMLPALAQAGVVDAGAAGLVELIRGIASALSGEPLPVAHLQPAPTLDSVHQELSRFTYCTAFVVEGDGLDADELEGELEAIGDSLLVVGDPSALKVHVHTDDPGKALSLGVARGTLANVEIANMHAQTLAREQRLLRAVPDEVASSAAVAVAAGGGNRDVFESFGVRVVDGGRTMNPSTAELLAAVESAGGREVILLPNDANVLMTAEQAARAASVPVSVFPTLTMQAGMAAAIAFDPSLPAAENLERMGGSTAGIGTGGITVSSRDVEIDGRTLPSGSWLGLVDGKPVGGGGTFDEAARVVLDELLATPRTFVTLLSGEERQPLDGLLQRLAGVSGLEYEVRDGGQPNYPLLVWAEE